MFATGTEEQNRERLRELGIPQSFHADILRRAGDAHYEKGNCIISVGSVALVAALGASMLWFVDILTAIALSRATAISSEVGGLLIYENVGFGPLVLFFAALLAGIPISLVATSQAQKRASTALSLIISNPTARRFTLGVENALRDATSADDFLDRLRTRSLPWLVTPVLLLCVAGVFISIAESRSFFVAGPNGIEHHRFWPPFTRESYSYSNATRLVVGCNHTDSDDFLNYEIVFADEKFDLGNARPLNGALVDTLEQIDATLPPTLTRERWDWLGRDPMAPQCVARWSGSVEDGPARVAHLLRVTASLE